MICPDHGLIWRGNPGEIVELYSRWVKQEPTRKAVIVFDTMWKSTEYMARALADFLSRRDVLVKVMNMKHTHRSDVVTEIYDAGAVLVGSPTINNDLYPTIAEILCYMRGLKFQNKIGASFGSYGWSGEAAKMAQNALADMKYRLVCPEARLQWVPAETDLEPLRAMADAVAEALPQAPVAPDCGL
jgi:flavorubredoxin